MFSYHPVVSVTRQSTIGNRQTAILFFVSLAALLLAHAPLLRLPYFWDEAGYYIPAARDLLLKGQLIPTSTVSSGHPPLVMGWIALWWKMSGSMPAVTRTAMLLIAAFGLLGVFRLAKQVSNTAVAAAATALTAIYPVWFAQSSLAHLDVAAAAFTFWGLDAYLRNRRWLCVLLFGIGGLAKETAVVTPLALCAYELLVPRVFAIWQRSRKSEGWSCLPIPEPGIFKSLALLACVLPLAAWFLYHRALTGVFFGNPEFFRYNVAATANPLRIPLALLQRLWHAFGYLNLFVLVGAAAMAMFYRPLSEPDGEERPRISLPVQAVFGLIILAYVVMLSVVGGAVIARYMLPVVPLVIIVAVSTLRRRISWWPWATVIVGMAFVLALFTIPPYRISPEDNLSYVDFVRLHQSAAKVIESRYPNSRVLTAWPASDELTRPWLRYVSKPMQVARIENFSLPQIQLAAEQREQYQIAYVFSTKLEPATPMVTASLWTRIQEKYFDYHRDLSPEAIAGLLGGRITYQARRGGEWVAIISIENVQNARSVPSLRDSGNL